MNTRVCDVELPSGFHGSGWSSKTEEAGDGGEQQLRLPDPRLRQDHRCRRSLIHNQQML